MHIKGRIFLLKMPQIPTALSPTPPLGFVNVLLDPTSRGSCALCALILTLGPWISVWPRSLAISNPAMNQQEKICNVAHRRRGALRKLPMPHSITMIMVIMVSVGHIHFVNRHPVIGPDLVKPSNSIFDVFE